MLKLNTFYEVIDHRWSAPKYGDIFLCLSSRPYKDYYSQAGEYEIIVLYKNKISKWYLFETHKSTFKEIE